MFWSTSHNHRAIGDGAQTPVQKHSLVPQNLPGRLDISVQVLLGRFPGTDPITRVIIGEHIAVDPGPEADVEAAHLAQIHGVPVGEQQRVTASGRAPDEHAADPVPAAGSGHEHLHGVELALRVLPVGALGEMQAGRAARVRVDGVRGLGRQERQFGRDATRTGRAAEEPAQLTEGETVHSRALLGHGERLIPGVRRGVTNSGKKYTNGLEDAKAVLSGSGLTDQSLALAF